jgi:hypothetical protein
MHLSVQDDRVVFTKRKRNIVGNPTPASWFPLETTEKNHVKLGGNRTKAMRFHETPRLVFFTLGTNTFVAEFDDGDQFRSCDAPPPGTHPTANHTHAIEIVEELNGLIREKEKI